MLKFSDIPEEMQTKAQEWAIDEALSAVFSDYEGGGYEVINTLTAWEPFDWKDEEGLLELTESFEEIFIRAWLVGYEAGNLQAFNEVKDDKLNILGSWSLHKDDIPDGSTEEDIEAYIEMIDDAMMHTIQDFAPSKEATEDLEDGKPDGE